MITKDYIEMCKQAFQLQKWYKSDVKNVHEGDKYICQCDTCKEAMFINVVADYDIDYINKRDMTDVDPIYKAMVDLSGVGCFGAFWDNEGFICLFSQEQLWEKIKEIYFTENTELMIRNDLKRDMYSASIYTEIDDSIYTEKVESKTVKECLLKLIMKEYCKIWDGKKWK